MDRYRHDRPVRHAKVTVSIDHHSDFEITTDDSGYAHFDASTQIQHLSLQLVDGDESVKDPVFELHDDQNYIKDGNVVVDIKEREVRTIFAFFNVSFLVSQAVTYIFFLVYHSLRSGKLY